MLTHGSIHASGSIAYVPQVFKICSVINLVIMKHVGYNIFTHRTFFFLNCRSPGFYQEQYVIIYCLGRTTIRKGENLLT